MIYPRFHSHDANFDLVVLEVVEDRRVLAYPLLAIVDVVSESIMCGRMNANNVL